MFYIEFYNLSSLVFFKYEQTNIGIPICLSIHLLSIVLLIFIQLNSIQDNTTAYPTDNSWHDDATMVNIKLTLTSIHTCMYISIYFLKLIKMIVTIGGK